MVSKSAPKFEVGLDYPSSPASFSLRPNQRGVLASQPWAPGVHGSSREDFMSDIGYLESQAWAEGEQKEWSPKVKMVLGIILSLLVLSPVILGLYWEILLPK